MRIVLPCTVLIGLLLSASVHAWVPAGIAAGDSIRFRATWGDPWSAALVHEIRGDTLFVGSRRQVDGRLDVTPGGARGAPVDRGAIGGLVGFAAGDRDGCGGDVGFCLEPGGAALVGGVTGGVVGSYLGTVLGALSPGRTWERVALTGLVLAPGRRGGLELGVSLAW